MLNTALIGYGGLGRSHCTNLIKMEESGMGIHLKAICDIDPSSFTKKVDINLGADKSHVDFSKYHIYNDAKEMLDKEELDFVLVVIPTYEHADIACMALNHGLHVFSEKPMALSAEEAQRMIDCAKANNRYLMIGQCLRFWPEYQKLKEIIDSGEYGKVIRAEFTRYSNTPIWSWQNWYLDEKRSGGAALDLHVHDVDIVNWLFGTPEAVSSEATHVACPFDSIFTRYKYPDKIVTTAADWGLAGTYPFKMDFLVRLEKATVVKEGNGITVYTDKEALKPALDNHDAYYTEIVHLADCIEHNKPLTVNPPESSKQSLTIALAEKRSALAGTPVEL